jgi:hypothetical protein
MAEKKTVKNKKAPVKSTVAVKKPVAPEVPTLPLPEIFAYLASKEFDARYAKVGAYLKGKVSGKRLVDINCNIAGTEKYLDRDYASYFGNDKEEAFLQRARYSAGSNAIFRQLSDKDVGDKIKQCDILIALGYGAAEKTGEPLESATLGTSIKKIIERCSPEIVVFEMIQMFEERYQSMSEMTAWMVSKGYKVDSTEAFVIPPGNGKVHKRVITFYVKG